MKWLVPTPQKLVAFLQGQLGSYSGKSLRRVLESNLCRINGRVERFYKDGELVMERRIPSDYLLTWLLARLDPLTFGSPAAKALALAQGDPRDKARNDLPQLMASLADVSEEDCPTEDIDYLDERLGEAGTGEPISDEERG